MLWQSIPKSRNIKSRKQMIDPDPQQFFIHGAQEQWSGIIYEPTDRVLIIKYPRVFSALNLNGIIFGYKFLATDLVRQCAIQIQAEIISEPNGSDRPPP